MLMNKSKFLSVKNGERGRERGESIKLSSCMYVLSSVNQPRILFSVETRV